MAQLLDLPTEIFQNVIHSLNSEHPRATWKLRSVCHTFAAEIKHDLLSNQPKHIVGLIPGVITANITTYVLAHLNKPADVDNRLLNTIRRMIDYLVSALSIPKGQRKETETRMVEGLVRVTGPDEVMYMMMGWRRSYRHPAIQLRNNPENGADIHHWEKIVAAMSTQAIDLIRPLLAQMPPAIWSPYTTFGEGPLVMAVTSKHDELFDAVLHHLNNLKKSIKRETLGCYDYNFAEAICSAIRAGNTRFVDELVKFRQTIFRRVEKRTYNGWLEIGIEHGNTDVVESILRLNPSGSLVNNRLFTIACRTGNVDMVNLLLDDEELEINDGTLFTNFLCCAIKVSDIPVVAAVLDAGADVNGAFPRYQRSTKTVSPMEVALNRNSKELLELLMSRGATMPPRARWPKTKMLYTMIREVAIANGATDIPAYSISLRRGLDEI